LLLSYDNVGGFYRKINRADAAERTLEEGSAFARQLIGAHPQAIETGDFRVRASFLLNHLAHIRIQTGRPAQAVAAWNEALVFLKQAGEQSPALLFDHNHLDTVYGILLKFLRKTHQDDLADTAVSEEVDYVVKLADKHPESDPAPWITPSLNRAISEIKNPDKAISLFRQAVGPCERRLERLKAKLGPNHPDTLASSQNLAQTYLAAMAYQAWFGREKEYGEACRRALELAKGSKDPVTLERCTKACSLRPNGDAARLAEALTFGRKAVVVGRGHGYFPFFQMALGMCEFRSGHFAEAEEILSAAMKNSEGYPIVWLTSAFYRAMSSYRRGKQDEARQLATEALAKMMKVQPPPAEQKAGFWHDDVILWMAYKEAKELLKLDSTSTSSGRRAAK